MAEPLLKTETLFAPRMLGAPIAERAEGEMADLCGRAVALVGAGIIGASCALHLAKAGASVTLLDPDPPGTGASFGNAGCLAVGEVIPLAMPGVLRSVPGWILDPLGPLVIPWRSLYRLAPWLARFVLASRRSRFERTLPILAALGKRVHSDTTRILRWADAEGLIVRADGLRLYADAAERAADGVKWELRRAAGVSFRFVERDEIEAMEPAVGPASTCGVVVEGHNHVRAPLALTQAIVRAAEELGATVLRRRVVGFETAGSQVTALRCDDESCLAADAVVLAAGAWSARLARALGDRLPLETERGYHAMIATPGVSVRRTLGVPLRGFVMTPMDTGLRICGTVEFAGLDSPPNFERARNLVRHAKAILPDLNPHIDSVWMGHRPSFPDGLPVIDRAPRHSNVIYAFGHGHMGLSWAATTGGLVVDILAGRASSMDISPFRATRFASSW